MNIKSLFGRKPSAQTNRVLAEFARAPSSWLYGYEMLERTGLGTGSLYTILNRLNERGLLESEWRGLNLDGQTGRPYRVYRLTDQGKEVAITELADQLLSRDLAELKHAARNEPVTAVKLRTTRNKPTEGEVEDKDCVV